MPKSWDASRYAMQYCVALDVGQQVDYSALSVVGLRAVQGPFDPESGTFEPVWEYHVRWLERYQLGTPFSTVVSRTVAISRDPALASGGDEVRYRPPHPAQIVMDSTGIGRPLIEMFQKQHGVYVVPITITGGAQVNQNASGFKVPKQDLVASLSVEFEMKTVKIASALDLSDDLLGELKSFRMQTSAATGRTTFDALPGTHDDLLISVALAVWWLREQRAREVGTMKIKFG